MIKIILVLIIIFSSYSFAQLGANRETKLLINELESFKKLTDSLSMLEVLADYEYENPKKLNLDSLVEGKYKNWWLRVLAIAENINALMAKPEISTRIQPGNAQYQKLFGLFKESTELMFQYLNGKISKEIKEKKASNLMNFYNSIEVGDIMCFEQHDDHGGTLTIKVAIIEKNKNSLKIKTLFIFDDDPWNHSTSKKDKIILSNITFELNKSTFISMEFATNFFKCN